MPSSIPWSTVGPIVSAVLVVLLTGYIFRRVYIVRDDEAIMIQDLKDFKHGVRGGFYVVMNPLESVIKGRKAPSLAYPSVDDNRKAKTGYLRASSGRISLHPQSCAPPPFTATSNDQHDFLVYGVVEFSIDFKNLRYIYEHGHNFGSTLVTRIETAFRDEIGQRNDEKVLGEQKQIREAVLRSLATDERGEGDAKPLGVVYHRVGFYADEFEGQALIAPPAPAGAAASQTRRPSAPAEPSPRTSSLGVAWLGTKGYDRISNAFKDTPDYRGPGLLAVLEMQNRRDIAEALARSGQLIVITSDELGLTGGGAQLDAVMKAVDRARSGSGGAAPN